MKQPTPNSTEGSRQIDMVFDVQLTHGISPQQREAALAGVLAEAAGAGGKETRNERA